MAGSAPFGSLGTPPVATKGGRMEQQQAKALYIYPILPGTLWREAPRRLPALAYVRHIIFMVQVKAKK